MKRYFIEIAYRGTAFHGWQIQPNANTIQAEIERVLQITLKENISIVGSGRTDTGVHATQQFAHFDTSQTLDSYTFLPKWNAILPNDIVIKQLLEVPDNAHARFDAYLRSYFYQIQQQSSPFHLGLAYYNPHTFRIDLMNQAAQKLLLYEDFEAFSKVKTDVKTFFCTISQAYWEETRSSFDGTPMLVFHISANRFLRGMVRAIVGTLLDVGQERVSIEQFEAIILSKNRKEASKAAPAQGLFLSQVKYPYTFKIV